MINICTIKVYLDGRENKVALKSKQLDTLRQFSATVITGERVLDLTQFTKAEIRWLKPDGNEVHDDCSISMNKVVVNVTQQMIAVTGDCKFEIILRNADGYVTTSTTIMNVCKTVHDDQAIESKSEYKTLDNALQSVASIDARINQLNETKVNRDEVIVDSHFKGKCTWTELQSKPGVQGDYWYCTDGNGTDPAGNYKHNGITWVFSGTGDDGYNKLKIDLSNLSDANEIKNCLRKGIVNGVTREWELNLNCVTTDKICTSNHNIYIRLGNDAYRYNVSFWKSASFGTSSYEYGTGWITGEYVIPKGKYFTIAVQKPDYTIDNEETARNALSIIDLAYREEIEELKERETLYHIIITGQSLSIGAEGIPTLTNVCPIKYEGKAFMFNGGNRLPNMKGNDSVTAKYTESTYMSGFTSLHEQDSQEEFINSAGEKVKSNAGETIGSWLGYWVADKLGRKVLVSNHGYGGKSYNELKKGTVLYDNAIRSVHRAKQLCKQFGMNYEVMCICVVHGEADQAGRCSAETYKGYLNQWQSDFESDIKEITEQSNDIPMFISQTGANYGYDLDVSNGVFLASVENPKIRLVVPQYAYPIEYWSAHMKNTGYRYLAEYFGNCIYRYFNGSSSNAIYPTKSVCSGNKITITFHANSANLKLNSFISVPDGNYGFTIDDSSGVTITNVVCDASSPKVTITLSGTPSDDAKISYAYKVYPEVSNKNPGYKTGIRGCLSDNGAFNCLRDNYAMYQWCCVFNIPVNYN